jgi:transposase
MIRPDFEKWNQSAEEMRRLSLEAEHKRSRERFQALYMIGTGQSNASQWAKTIKRCKQTVLGWVHGYNEAGLSGVYYQHTGGPTAKLSEAEKKTIVDTVIQSQPQDHQLPGYGWTLKKLRQWVEQQLGHQVSKSTLRKLLKAAGLSWKKSKKVLAKADPKERAAYVQRFQAWYEQVCRGELRLIYVDEVHLHQDLELGYRWSVQGEADWVASHCPPLKNRLNWYGAYDFSTGQCFIWHQGCCNGDQTIAFLYQLLKWLGDDASNTLIIWDGAPWHNRCAKVQQHADKLGFTLHQLPAYSPDLNPTSGLWKWMREDLSQHHCFKYLYLLEQACFDFIDRINLDPVAIISRLWPKFDLDPSYEKVLVSS